MSYSPGRSFALGAYLTGSATNGDAWRAPGEDVDADISFERYRSYVDLLEQGRFDSIFLYDNVLPILILQRLLTRLRWLDGTLLRFCLRWLLLQGISA